MIESLYLPETPIRLAEIFLIFLTKTMSLFNLFVALPKFLPYFLNILPQSAILLLQFLELCKMIVSILVFAGPGQIKQVLFFLSSQLQMVFYKLKHLLEQLIVVRNFHLQNRLLLLRTAVSLA